MDSSRHETTVLVLGDIVLLALSLWFALVLRNFRVPALSYYLEHLQAFWLLFVVSIIVFFIAGLYERQTRLVKGILGIRVFGAQVTNTVLAAIFFFILPFSIAPKTVLAIYLVVSVVLISLWRYLAVPYLSVSKAKHAILVGCGDLVAHVFEQVNGTSKYYVRFTAAIDPKGMEADALAMRLRDEVRKGARLVVLDTRDTHVRDALPHLYDLVTGGVEMVEFSTFFEDLFDRVPLNHIDHAWLLAYLPRQSLLYAFLKRTVDIVGAAIGLVLASPFIFLGMVLILAGGGTPFIFHHRVGKNGKVFHMVKLRSMLFDDKGDPVLREKNRVTAVGRLLRKTRVDELPQLWNVLIGDLSFIGPRPEMPAFAQVYGTEIPYYDIRHLISPGLSGWAQIYDYDAPRGGIDVVRTERKLSYDLYYVKHRSFTLDMMIALKTLRALASFSGS